MKKLFFILIPIIFFILIVFYFAVKYIAPGPYSYAEVYEFEISDSLLEGKIETLKKLDSQFAVPDIYINNRLAKRLTDGKADINDWYYVYFYYADRNQIVFFWITSVANNRSNLAFVSVNQGLELGHWKDINSGYKGHENEEVKREFEKRILDKIGVKYKDQGNSMKVLGIQL